MPDPATATIERAYRVRLRPTPAQASTLRRIFGARRAVWNWAIREQAAARARDEKRPGLTALSAAFTVRRTTGETAWLSQLPREPFNQTLRDLDQAWSRFFSGQNRRPTRKLFGSVNSARFTLDQRRVGLVTVAGKKGRVQLDGIGKVVFRATEAMPGRLRSVTVSVDAAGRWFASFTADQVPAPAAVPAPRAAVGIDLGLKDTAVLSDGTRIAAAKSLAKKRKRLRRYQRSYNRGRDAQLRTMGLDPRKTIPKGTKIPASKRMQKRKAQIGRLHAEVADVRRDHQHQLTARAVGSATVICLEDLAVKGMGQALHRGFRRSVADAGLGEVKRQIVYKAAWQGRVVSVVHRFFPSSKICSACGAIHAGLSLRDRRWVCPSCGVNHDRDENAATNIEREGLRLLEQGTCPEGPTRRSREREARGAGACAAGRSSPAGQPTARKRELSYRGAQRRTPAEAHHDVAPRVGEG
jgi:putative transposase